MSYVSQYNFNSNTYNYYGNELRECEKIWTIDHQININQNNGFILNQYNNCPSCCDCSFTVSMYC
jgi:hypothetical protein